MPEKFNAFVSRMRIFKCKRRHLFRSTTVHDVYVGRAKTHRRNRGIDRSVSRSDNNNALWRRGYRARLITGN